MINMETLADRSPAVKKIMELFPGYEPYRWAEMPSMDNANNVRYLWFIDPSNPRTRYLGVCAVYDKGYVAPLGYQNALGRRVWFVTFDKEEQKEVSYLSNHDQSAYGDYIQSLKEIPWGEVYDKEGRQLLF